MRRLLRRTTLDTSLILAATAMTAVVAVYAQPQGETFTAQASVKAASGSSASTPVTMVVHRFATDAEREMVVAAVKQGGTAARDLLAKRDAVGEIDVNSKRVAIRYAYARSVGAGRLITLVTSEPIGFVMMGQKEAKPKAGYDLGLVLLDLSASPGTGEVAPAAKVKVDAQGAIVTEDYGAEAVRLSNVVRK